MKNKFKISTIILAIVLMFSSFCYAEDAQTPIEPRTTDVEQINATEENQTPIEPRTSDVEEINVTEEAVTTNLEKESETTDLDIEEEVIEEPEIHEGDLYIFEDNVNMDKLVDGNVYIIGKNVTITGQIAGNLFVMADNLTIGDDTSASSYNGYVFYNIYALANKATLYSSCYDLYIAGNDITINPSFYLYRDLKMGAKHAKVFATIGRNADIEAKNITLSEDDAMRSAAIYGNLNYTTNSQIADEILNSSVVGESNFTQARTSSVNFSKVVIFALISILISLLILILIIALIIKLILFAIRKTKASKDNKEIVVEETKNDEENSIEETKSNEKNGDSNENTKNDAEKEETIEETKNDEEKEVEEDNKSEE